MPGVTVFWANTIVFIKYFTHNFTLFTKIGFYYQVHLTVVCFSVVTVLIFGGRFRFGDGF